MKLKGKVYETVVRQALLYGADTWSTTRGQEARLEVNEMRMRRWMCGVTRRDMIRNEHIGGKTRVVQASKKITEKRLKLYGHVRRMKEEHIVRRMLDVEIPVKRTKGAAKPKMERRMQERHDRDRSGRGQDNRQGSMGEYHHQLYRRPQTTGQAREEDEEEEEEEEEDYSK